MRNCGVCWWRPDIGSADLRERLQLLFPGAVDRSFQDNAGRVGVIVPTEELFCGSS
ncbi:hypothetical protein VQ056_03025 [Paenibacillus sp. JTLBN-2024]